MYAISNSTTSLSDSSGTNNNTRLLQDFPLLSSSTLSLVHQQIKIKRKRSLPGNPDPDVEVIALSPRTLLATNRFVCKICNKGFQRDQNLQLHRRGHNLPWKLKQRNSNEIVRKRAYVCPEPSCVHHHPSRSLGDLTGIKKHYCRKHGEKIWKCEKCAKIYAVQSDWKAHSKTCGTREYRCDCGTIFSRKDSFITHRAFCDALAEESARLSANQFSINGATNRITQPALQTPIFNFPSLNNNNITSIWDHPQNPNPNPNSAQNHLFQSLSSTTTDSSTVTTQHQAVYKDNLVINSPFRSLHVTHPATSAIALLQKAATIGSTAAPQPAALGGGYFQNSTSMVAELGGSDNSVVSHALGFVSTWQQKSDRRLTRDFLGLQSVDAVNVNMKGMLTYAGGVDLQQQQQQNYECVPSLLRPHHNHGFIFSEPTSSEAWGNC